jgi:starch-binding outer membrane protein, SusD/RagB family
MNLHIIQKLAAGLLLTGALAGCSKSMLKEDLYSQPGSTNVTGPAGAALLTNGIYSYVQFLSYFGGNNWLLDNEANTDEFYCAWGDLDPASWGGQQNFLNEDPGHYQVQLKWDNLYFMIAQANQVINQFSALTDAATIQNVAQARFWRAYAYEKLYYVYGPVPLVTGKEDQTNGIAKASAADIESFIQSELTAVETILPGTYAASDYGRPTKWAVKAFLARFYLNTKNWQKASDYAHDVIVNGGFTLQTDYQSIFGQNGNNEVILAVNHMALANRGNKYIALSMDAPLETAFGITGVSASSGYGMATQFYYSFAAGDKRVAPYNPSTALGIAIAGIQYNPNGTPVYGTAAAPKKVEDALNRVITCKWPVIMNIPNGEDAPLNLPLLRLGETWLTYAEAQNELGNLSEAINAVNNLRPRTGLAPVTATSQAAMRDSILNERGWELYHEGYRREDLVRAGKQKFMDKVNAKYQFYFKIPMPWATDTNRVIQPIPTTALQLNPLLKQNAGY